MVAGISGTKSTKEKLTQSGTENHRGPQRSLIILCGFWIFIIPGTE